MLVRLRRGSGRLTPARGGAARLARAAVALCVLAAGAEPLRAQSVTDGPAPSREEQVRALRSRRWEIRAERVGEAIRLDGRLDETAWESATPISDFYQRERRDVIPATERTEVRVLYDDTMLYVGFRCFDREPGKARARALFRDESAGADDLVSLMLDSYDGRRTAIQFVSNMNGLMEDLFQLGEVEGTRNHDFDAVWHAHGRRMTTGYEVEIGIPFKSLRFAPRAPDAEVPFGIGFKRNIPRKNEEVIWPFVSNDSSWYRPAELGHVRGIAGIRPGRNLELRPYALAGGAWDLSARARGSRREIGLDTKWGVTTGLTADFTVNTDFAQEEADVQQVNLTRFSLFFPEKRQFFLEGQQMFQFGVPKEADLVFTRRIGLSRAGDVVPINWGARLSGRQGRTSLGAMHLDTDAVGARAGEGFSVLRVKRDVFSRSSVGALVTNVASGGTTNRVVGADAGFLFKDVWSVEGFAAVSSHTGRPDATAAYARTAFETDRYGVSYRFLGIEEDFASAVGFVQRPDSKQHAAEGRFSPRPDSDLIRQYTFTGQLGYVTGQLNRLETRERAASASAAFESGDAVTVKLSDQLESLAEPFTLRRDVTLAPGTYRFTSVTAQVDTFRRRPATLNLGITSGGFWGGHRDTVSLKAAYRLSSHLGVSGGYDVNWIDLPQRAFTTHLASAKLQVAFRNDVALFSLLQYNRDTRQLSSNIRFNWIPKPGTDFFIVYNELDSDRGGLTPRNRSLTIKLAYLFSL